IVGEVNAANSLVGSTNDDYVGGEHRTFIVADFGELVLGTVQALPNGNYVVASQRWDNGAVVDAGAVTLVNGTTGMVGPVTTGNSLCGSADDDYTGATVTVLPNSN